MAGTRSTIGLVSRVNNIVEEDSSIVICAKNSGMIPFIKTNVPQIPLSFDSFNFLWGRTLNPWNSSKSAGGSSGGEGACIASMISPVGIGNDRFGSVRIPAAFNGVVGMKSSSGRLPQMKTVTYKPQYLEHTPNPLLAWTRSRWSLVL
jgi:Asp-tRNA(Asn)/Glu-tRNA(Gln) amidotransferase A subunit family amidase